MGFEWFWRFAGRQAGPRDGQGLSLDALDLPDPALAAPLPTTSHAMRRDSVEATLALKTLSAHLANFRQVSFPLTLDFRSLSAEEADLAIDAAVSALEVENAGGDEVRRTAATEALKRLGATPAQLERFGAPDPASGVGALAERAHRLDKAAHVYAVSLLALGNRSGVAQAYLAYLAARLGLTQNVVGSLNRRFRG